jgi:hypothetical protein
MNQQIHFHRYRIDERTRLDASQTDRTERDAEYTPLIAENRSYYGELNQEGRPKTVYVKGYHREDGSNVRTHFRAMPRQKEPYGFKIDGITKLNWLYYGDPLNKSKYLETILRDPSLFSLLKIRVPPIKAVSGL